MDFYKGINIHFIIAIVLIGFSLIQCNGIEALKSRSSTNQKPEEVEPDCQEEGFHGSNKNCSLFYRCVSEGGNQADPGWYISEGGNQADPGWYMTGQKFRKYNFECPPGTVFDPLITGCNYPEKLAPNAKCMQSMSGGAGTQNEEQQCFNTRCHAHSEGSWCPENMVTKNWHYCAGVFGKWEECCTR